MDLIDSLQIQAAALPQGPYTAGIEAVLLHLNAAFRHRQRGIENDDETFFTDAIYRSNQAFEGSVKEAYRVLAGKDPSQKRPFDIEGYLESNGVFTARILKQFTNYRKEWRNPSTHDYKLKFDQSESLLAIVTVAAFASMLIDQMSGKLAFDAAQREVRSSRAQVDQTLETLRNKATREKISALIQDFCSNHYPHSVDGRPVTERQLLGALHGYLVSMLPDLAVETDVRLGDYSYPRPDWVISVGSDRVVAEFKRTHVREVMAHSNALSVISSFMEATGIRSGILVYLPTASASLDAEEITFKNAERTMGGMITVLAAPRESATARDANAA